MLARRPTVRIVLDQAGSAASDEVHFVGDSSRPRVIDVHVVQVDHKPAGAVIAATTRLTGVPTRNINVWRETRVDPSDTHAIHLESPENGAMIETYDDMPGSACRSPTATRSSCPE
jgi:hypothetical protein